MLIRAAALLVIFTFVSAAPTPSTTFHGCPSGMKTLYYENFEEAFLTDTLQGEWDREDIADLLTTGFNGRAYLGGKIFNSFLRFSLLARK